MPKGEVRTYKQVAKSAGQPGACRAVGNILNRHGGMERGIPCHRVIRSDGKIGGFKDGTRKKIELLKKEKAI
ncbi:MAG: MGMT family protein [Candidatus Paceibacterota bacterium]